MSMPMVSLLQSPDGYIDVHGYPETQSKFYHVMANRNWGVTGNDLPPALRPNPTNKFTTSVSDVGPKYGVRAYAKAVAEREKEAQDKTGQIVRLLLNPKNTRKNALSLVQIMNRCYSICVETRQRKAGPTVDYKLSRWGLVPILAEVIKETTQEVHQERLLFDRRVDIFNSAREIEYLESCGNLAITQHAMERIWQRSPHNHNDFHLAMREVFQRMQLTLAVLWSSYHDDGLELPSYLAVPFLGGMMILSSRRVTLNVIVNRKGIKRIGREAAFLYQDNPKSFPCEYKTGQTVAKDAWFAATFMSEKDIGNFSRVEAARAFNAELAKPELDEAIHCWRHYLVTGQAGVSSTLNGALDRKLVRELQERMLPRLDPPDDRIYALTRDGW